MTDIQAELYLQDRAYNEGITVEELLDMTPSSVSDDPIESATFWQGRDYSHVMPVSTHPHLADDADNAMPEDPSVNRSRGAEPMTELEKMIAEYDNELFAAQIDAEYTHDDYVIDFQPLVFF